jgi:hypothetical protein
MQNHRRRSRSGFQPFHPPDVVVVDHDKDEMLSVDVIDKLKIAKIIARQNIEHHQEKNKENYDKNRSGFQPFHPPDVVVVDHDKDEMLSVY